MEKFSKKISDILLFIMNIALAIIGFCLVFAMLVETWEIVLIAKSYFQNDDLVYTKLIEEIITFFLYFEFIALIIKYFKNNFHFPLRYFIYIGITAIVRLIIVQHEEPKSVLIWAGAILFLMISLAIAEKFIKGD